MTVIIPVSRQQESGYHTIASEGNGSETCRAHSRSRNYGSGGRRTNRRARPYTAAEPPRTSVYFLGRQRKLPKLKSGNHLEICARVDVWHA